MNKALINTNKRLRKCAHTHTHTKQEQRRKAQMSCPRKEEEEEEETGRGPENCDNSTIDIHSLLIFGLLNEICLCLCLCQIFCSIQYCYCYHRLGYYSNYILLKTMLAFQ